MDFRDAYRRDSAGRFIVPLLVQEDPKQLGESRETAIKRLQSLHKRLEFKLELRAQYTVCLQEYLSLDHMTKVDKKIESLDPFHYYLPHAVMKEVSSTTKLRIAFDGSCKTTSGKSLNDILRVGPTIQQELFAIILRFRQHTC